MTRGRARPDVLLVGDGTNIHVRRLAEALAGHGLAVELACFEGQPIAGVVIHRVGRMPPAADLRYLVGVPTLARLLRRRRPRVVHGLYISSYGLMTALASHAIRLRERDSRIVLSPLGTDLLVTARQRRWRAAAASYALRSADLVTFNAASLAYEIKALAPNTAQHRFVWGPSRALMTAPRADRRLAVSTRRHELDMRIELVIEGWRDARRQAPAVLDGWKLVVTHGGSRLEHVRQAALGDDSIELAGVLSYEALHQLLLSASILISAPVSDATSAALMDGLAAGVTPVVNAIPGTLEWVDETIAEIVPRDPTAVELAEAIVRATQRTVNRNALRARVADILWEDQVPALISAYRQLSGD